MQQCKRGLSLQILPAGATQQEGVPELTVKSEARNRPNL